MNGIIPQRRNISRKNRNPDRENILSWIREDSF